MKRKLSPAKPDGSSPAMTCLLLALLVAMAASAALPPGSKACARIEPVGIDNSGQSALGSKIVFGSARDAGPGRSDIYTMNADGSEPTRLTFDNSYDDTAPSWSPNGQQIVFASNRDGDYEIFVMDADGSNQIQMTFNHATDGQPLWSHNGNAILFTSQRDGNSEIYVMNADGSDQTNLTNNGAFDEPPSWSPERSDHCIRQ